MSDHEDTEIDDTTDDTQSWLVMTGDHDAEGNPHVVIFEDIDYASFSVKTTNEVTLYGHDDNGDEITVAWFPNSYGAWQPDYMRDEFGDDGGGEEVPSGGEEDTELASHLPTIPAAEWPKLKAVAAAVPTPDPVEGSWK